MSRKRRLFTAAERAEAHRLCFAGRSGTMPVGGTERAMAQRAARTADKK